MISPLQPVGDSDWSDYTLDRMFVGRESELNFLRSELLQSEAKIVVMTGAPGSGKTALAMMFAQVHRKDFPAGTYHIHTTPWETLRQTVDAHVSRPNAPYLLILDDFESRQSVLQGDEIAELHSDRPSARIISIGRPYGLSVPAYPTLVLNGLQHSDIEELFRRRGARSNKFFELGLFQALRGSPILIRQVLELLNSKSLSLDDVAHHLKGASQTGIVGPFGEPLVSGAGAERELIADVSVVNSDLLRHIHSNPKHMYELTPRQFEEFVAEVLDRLGYEVTLTPASRDGGKDIYAAKKDHLGSFLYVVECKKYAPENHVGVGLIRQLNGVVHAERATAGILATTSFFTRDAREFQQRVAHTMTLRDYLGLQGWLQDVFRAQ